MEARPTVIPTAPFNYHIDADSLEEEALTKFGPNGETRTHLLIFSSDDEATNKWTLTCELWIVIKNGELTVETRNLGYEAGWERNQVTPEPQKQASLKFSFLPLKPHEEMVYAADSPLAGGVVSLAFTAKNIGTVQADNGQIWIQLCDGCRFASEPEGSNVPPDDPTVRRKRFDHLHIGVYFDSTVLKIIPPADSSYFTIVFKYACEQCPEIDNKNPQKLRVNVLR